MRAQAWKNHSQTLAMTAERELQLADVRVLDAIWEKGWLAPGGLMKAVAKQYDEIGLPSRTPDFWAVRESVLRLEKAGKLKRIFIFVKWKG